eukprot:TRINITY_DN3476_c0_g1_i1.p1 TRINITY_DN3476_c0_g1~~TRINITY_DN3476_c0_g1_i1.p1  ORF type:complete len:346 (-),score=93.91 TRINITY_DN3476_c0_g1_i1:421-1458(-)
MNSLTLCILLFACLCGASNAYSNYSFVVITDTHIGHQIDGAYHGEDTTDTKNLEATVEKINTLISSSSLSPSVSSSSSLSAIDFAVVLGDLSDKAQNSQFEKARDILSKLKVPYLPLLGNHDVYQVVGKTRDPLPDGDHRFYSIFQSTFSSFTRGKIIALTGNQAVKNSEVNNTNSYFQNWAMEKEGVLYLALDWVSRKTGPVRADSHAELHNFLNGTYNWLDSFLSSLNNDLSSPPFRSVVLMQHHPTHCFPLIAWWMCFNDDQLVAIQTLIKKHVGRGRLPALPQWQYSLVGHLHAWKEDKAFEKGGAEWNTLTQWETATTLDGVAFAVVSVIDGHIVKIEKN